MKKETVQKSHEMYKKKIEVSCKIKCNKSK